MANGDRAAASSFPVVQSSGLVSKGYDEINLSRDLIADVKVALDSRFTGKITRGTTTPNNASGANGDIYLKMV